MIDKPIINVISGKGGNGAVSGRREKFVPLGGPDGGDGGRGGDIYVRSDTSVNTLLAFRYRRKFQAGDGANGSGGRRHGKDGTDVELPVPVGTQIWSCGGDESLLADLGSHGQRVKIAEGGAGGRGNARFASPTNRFPLLAEAGEAGEELGLRLELKLLADVGIVGAPNAGKSSLLAAVSAARPKVASYPFTTLEPALGVVDRGHRTFLMVDIPGLIEGAHSGVGLGHDFLRHVERTRVLVHVVDGTLTDVVEQYRAVREEIGLFDEKLLGKPEVVAVNKLDVPEVEARCHSVRRYLGRSGTPVHCISAVGRQGLDRLLDAVEGSLAAVEQQAQQASREEQEDVPIIRPRPATRERPAVRKTGRGYVVASPPAERLAAMVDANDWPAMSQLYDQLRRLGVIDVLEKAGIGPGEVFRIGELELEWE